MISSPANFFSQQKPVAHGASGGNLLGNMLAGALGACIAEVSIFLNKQYIGSDHSYRSSQSETPAPDRLACGRRTQALQWDAFNNFKNRDGGRRHQPLQRSHTGNAKIIYELLCQIRSLRACTDLIFIKE